MAFCIPPAQAKALAEALEKAGTSPPDLMDMSSSEARRAFFEKYVSKEDAKEINTALEKTILLKDQNAGYLRWYNKIKGDVPKSVQRDLLHKIEKLDKVLNPDEEKAFMADLAESKLGSKVSFEEAQRITALAQRATLERDKATTNLSGVSNEFLKSAADLEHYVRSIKPTTAVASIGKNAAIIARNHILMNPATPVKTTVGQVVNSSMDMVTRRIATASLRGESSELAAEANKQAWKTFRETGFNTAMMESYEDSGRLGERSNFDVPEGMLSSNPLLHAVESGVRGYAKFTNKIAIDLEHNFTFTKFHQMAFFDGLNIGATNIARSEGVTGAALRSRADAIFADAAKIKPETDLGAIVRMESQKQAARVTSTNDTLISRYALAVKDALNKHVANGVGDALMPIAKIPANIVANALENSGPGIILGGRDIVKGRAKMQSADLATRYEGMAQFSNGIQRVARTAGVMGAAALFSSSLSKKDFREDNWGNSFVKIGNIWINTEYFSAVSPAMAGMMYVKQYGHGSVLRAPALYAAGALQELGRAPGVNEVHDLVTSLRNKNWAAGVEKYAENFFTSRGVPAFFHNMNNDRPMDRLFFGAHGVETQAQVNNDNAEKKAQAAKTRAATARFNALGL